MKSRYRKGTAGAALLLAGLLAGAGCSRPNAPTSQTSDQLAVQLADSQIQSIQNNPQMSPEAKQRAIAALKLRQKAAVQTSSGATTR